MLITWEAGFPEMGHHGYAKLTGNAPLGINLEQDTKSFTGSGLPSFSIHKGSSSRPRVPPLGPVTGSRKQESQPQRLLKTLGETHKGTEEPTSFRAAIVYN